MFLESNATYLSANTGLGACAPEEVEPASGVAAVVLVTLVLLVVPNLVLGRPLLLGAVEATSLLSSFTASSSTGLDVVLCWPRRPNDPLPTGVLL